MFYPATPPKSSEFHSEIANMLMKTKCRTDQVSCLVLTVIVDFQTQIVRWFVLLRNCTQSCCIPLLYGLLFVSSRLFYLPGEKIFSSFFSLRLSPLFFYRRSYGYFAFGAIQQHSLLFSLARFFHRVSLSLFLYFYNARSLPRGMRWTVVALVAIPLSNCIPPMKGQKFKPI